ncbi:MAG: lysostaphin resistance A-like protein [Sarcina sp.]
MKFLKENIITDLINNKTEIKPLSIFKLILAYIVQNIIVFMIIFGLSFIYGLYIVFTGNESFVIQSILTSIGSFVGLLITIKIFSGKKRQKKTDPNFGYEYIEDIESVVPRQTPLKINKKIVRACVFLGLGYLLMNCGTLQHLLSNVEMPAEINEIFNTIMEQHIVFIVFSIVIEAAIVEEIMCRGFVLNGLLNKYSPKVAIFISASLFGIMHMNIPQFINATIMGIMFGIVYYQTRSLLACMMIHAANNFFAFFVLMPETTGFKVVVSLIYVVIGFLLFRKGFKDLDLMKTMKEFFPKKEKVHQMN